MTNRFLRRVVSESIVDHGNTDIHIMPEMGTLNGYN